MKEKWGDQDARVALAARELLQDIVDKNIDGKNLVYIAITMMITVSDSDRKSRISRSFTELPDNNTAVEQLRSSLNSEDEQTKIESNEVPIQNQQLVDLGQMYQRRLTMEANSLVYSIMNSDTMKENMKELFDYVERYEKEYNLNELNLDEMKLQELVEIIDPIFNRMLGVIQFLKVKLEGSLRDYKIGFW